MCIFPLFTLPGTRYYNLIGSDIFLLGDAMGQLFWLDLIREDAKAGESNSKGLCDRWRT